jgi:hypothetical protein
MVSVVMVLAFLTWFREVEVQVEAVALSIAVHGLNPKVVCATNSFFIPP